MGGINYLYKLLCPQIIVKTLYDIEIHTLQQKGIRGIIFDLDNTIIAWDSPTMSPEIIQLINNLLTQGFNLCLVSNNMDKRVKNIADIFNIPYVSRAYKPAKSGFRRAITAMGLTDKQVAVIGDQLFTDVLGGNRLGLYTIWVAPLSSKEFMGTKITRCLEKLTIRILRAKGLMK